MKKDKPPKVNLAGKRFGRLVIVEFASRQHPNGENRWRCKCDCGGETTTLIGNLVSGNTNSCGCYAREMAALAQLKHGESIRNQTSSEYRTWCGIMRRCYNPNTRNFLLWGGRGITVCERWRSGFVFFLEDMGRKPSPKHSIDRYPNNDGNYEPGNCRWATAKEQSLNSRHCRNLTFNGETMPLSEWAKRLRISEDVIWSRLNVLDWSVELALTTPVRKLRRRR